jgi:hypothetical protein
MVVAAVVLGLIFIVGGLAWVFAGIDKDNDESSDDLR